MKEHQTTKLKSPANKLRVWYAEKFNISNLICENRSHLLDHF